MCKTSNETIISAGPSSASATAFSLQARDETARHDQDPDRPNGTIELRIENFCEFVRDADNVACSEFVLVRGLRWALWAVVTEQKSQFGGQGTETECSGSLRGLNFYLECDAPEENILWSCSASARFLQKSKHFANEQNKLRFSSNSRWSAFGQIHVDGHPGVGWYQQNTDSAVFKVEVEAEVPRGTKQVPRPDVVLVNGERVDVNRYLLAAHSPYFETLFLSEKFREGSAGLWEIGIDARREPAGVEHFRRMVAAMYPENRPLDDDCVEGVLHLANRFMLTTVKDICADFLASKSAQPALFKYRLAVAYGLQNLKEHVLTNLKKGDFGGPSFVADFSECEQIDGRSRKELVDQYFRLYSVD